MYDFDTVRVRNCTPNAVVDLDSYRGRQSRVPSVGDSFETETFGRKKKNADLPAGRQVFMMININ